MVVGSFPEVSQTFVVDHIKGLTQRGWDVQVAARKLHRDRLGSLEIANVTAHELKFPPRSQPIRRLVTAAGAVAFEGLRQLRSVSVRSASYHVPSLQRLIAETTPALIHAHFAHNGFLALMAAKETPVIVNYHGYDVLSLPEEEGWEPFAHFLNGSHGIVHSSFLEHEVAAHLNVRLHRVTLGVDQSLFRGRNRGHRWPEAPTLLTVGRLVDVKGHDVAIKAFATLVGVENFRSARLVIVGEGPEHGSLVNLASDLGVQDQVVFTGALSQTGVAEKMASADFLLMPSLSIRGWQESFGRVAVEGLASGLAVIGTQTGGLAETIGSGGWAVEPGDHQQLAEKIAEIRASAAPSEVAQRAREQAARFGINKMWEDYDSVTRSVISGSDC